MHFAQAVYHIMQRVMLWDAGGFTGIIINGFSEF